ncbi:hypothetical protein [Hyphococcus sp.]|uniref:hypothetical protein n=1 Tax=Hyphococcus sp. TaxID=2038636 RepID=UPI003D140AA3
MRRILKTALLGFAMAATASTAFALSSKEAQKKLSKYEKTGETLTCLPLHAVRDTDALDDYTLLVEATGGVYLNELNGRCSGLGREERYVRRSSDARMCKGDIIRVIDSFGTTMGSCSLGAFEKLSELPEEDTQSE